MKIFHRVSRLILPALALSALVQAGPHRPRSAAGQGVPCPTAPLPVHRDHY